MMSDVQKKCRKIKVEEMTNDENDVGKWSLFNSIGLISWDQM